MTVNLTGVDNAQTIVIALAHVSDSINTRNVQATMGVLIGDVTGIGDVPDGVVSNVDVAAVKTLVGAPVTTANFRNDLDANGVISNVDVAAVKVQVGARLP